MPQTIRFSQAAKKVKLETGLGLLLRQNPANHRVQDLLRDLRSTGSVSLSTKNDRRIAREAYTLQKKDSEDRRESATTFARRIITSPPNGRNDLRRWEEVVDSSTNRLTTNGEFVQALTPPDEQEVHIAGGDPNRTDWYNDMIPLNSSPAPNMGGVGVTRHNPRYS